MVKIKKYSLSKQEKAEVIKKISACLLRHDEIYAAYIFGSFIDAKTFADIDLGIILRHKFDDPFEYEIELERKLEKLVQFSTDVRDLNSAPLSFSQNAIRHGQVIVNTDPNRRADFETYVLKKYFDFAHFRRRYLADVVNAPI